MENKNKNKVKLIDKLNHGRIWLNIIKTEEGIELFTVNRSYPTFKGWKNSPFFQMEMGDIESIKVLLERYQQHRAEHPDENDHGMDIPVMQMEH